MKKKTITGWIGRRGIFDMHVNPSFPQPNGMLMSNMLKNKGKPHYRPYPHHNYPNIDILPSPSPFIDLILWLQLVSCQVDLYR